MEAGPLADAVWECASTLPDAFSTPAHVAVASLDWMPAPVPGTVAAACRAAGRPELSGEDLDGRDWWYRTTVTLAPGGGRWWLHAAGLATICDLWVDDRLVLHSENMFVGHWVDLDALGTEIAITLRCAALGPHLAVRRPRPRWKSRLVGDQRLRAIRTSIWGRMPATPFVPAPVGPWRPLTLRPTTSAVVFDRRLDARPHGRGGTVAVTVSGAFVDGPPADQVRVHVGGVDAPMTVSGGDGVTWLRATVTIDEVERWWPHTHGCPRLYPVELTVGPERIGLGSVGFRTVTADRAGDGFTLVVNDVPVFARGACWIGPDPLDLVPEPGAVRAALERFASTGFNLVRNTGITVYEEESFWDACDALGILVWSDAMLSALDVPATPELVASVTDELTQVFTRAANHPSLAVICGGAETEQQPAMLGLPPDVWTQALQGEVIPQILNDIDPAIPYVASSPTGGDFPFSPNAGVVQYFGVGAYLRPLDDARRSAVPFASECLALSNLPEATAVDFPDQAGHSPAWKSAVPRDPGASWDFEDVRDYYVRHLFDVDPLTLRYLQPELALDYGRAASVELMVATLAEWRRESSPCAGAVVQSWQDLIPGAGWGITEASGAPKAPWYGLRRLLTPVSVWLVGEGLAGLRLHVANDLAVPLHGTVTVELWTPDGRSLESASAPVSVDAHGSIERSVDRLFEGFRDLTYAYHFGPPVLDAVVAELDTGIGPPTKAFFLPLGPARPRIPDCGLAAVARPAGDGTDAWNLIVTTATFAHYVSVVIAGFEPSDSWFHLEPGGRAEIGLRPVGSRARPTGEVRALNSVVAAGVDVES